MREFHAQLPALGRYDKDRFVKVAISIIKQAVSQCVHMYSSTK